MPNTDDEWPVPRYEVEPVPNSRAWRVLRDGKIYITTNAHDSARAVAWEICVALNTVAIHGPALNALIRSGEVAS